MLTARHVIFGLALLLASPMESLSQGPLPGALDQNGPQQSKPQSHSNPTAPELYGTEQSPFIVRNSKGKEEAAKDEQERQDKTFNDYVTIFLSIAVAIGTLLQANALFVIICTTRRQLRAYIAIERALSGGDYLMPKFDLRFKNCGQTPAYKGTYWVDIQVGSVPLTTDLVASERKLVGKFEMPPTNIFSMYTDDNIVSIPVDRDGEFKEREIAIYIFGQLDFVDAFDKWRWLKFRCRYGFECGDALEVENIKSN
jgi:hypothetical protein